MKTHFIGIGGIGISALARLYLHEGAVVTGSDKEKSKNTKKLEAEGATIFYEQTAKNITKTTEGFNPSVDLVVYSEAVPADNPELVAAREAGIKTVSYFEALAEIANEYYLIAVTGTHGKTTTTAMLADILEEASFDPTVVVGSLRTKTGSNFRPGKSKYFVVEADEYMRHFLHFSPDVLVITNIDLDHPDYFCDLPDVQAAFATLVATVPDTGSIIANTSDPHVKPVLEDAVAPVVDYHAVLNLTRSLRQPGLHNRENAAAAEAAAQTLGVEQRFIDTALEHFLGTARRFEYKGSVQNAPVYDDYAHNPQKITAAISGAREMHPDTTLTVVFQPHTYSRTKTLFAAFVDALTHADRVLLLPIFAAREVDDGSISSEDIVAALQEQGVDASYFHTLAAAALHIEETVSENDIVMTVGAGEVTKVSEMLTS